MTVYKEDKEKVNQRSRKHRATKTTKKLEIVGLQPEELQEFQQLATLAGLNHADKLRALMNWWKTKPVECTPSLPCNEKEKLVQEQEVTPVITPQIENWSEFEKKFRDFLWLYKSSNRLRTGLRKQGMYVREALQENPDFKSAFHYIAGRLITSLQESFKKNI